MSALKSLINKLLYSNLSTSNLTRQTIYKQALALSLSDSQQLIRELSYILYQKQQQCKTLLNVLYFIKQLLLTASLPLYLLINVYIFPWIISINKLHADRPLAARAQLLSRNVFGKKQNKAGQSVVQCHQFLVFFGQNMKFHPYSKYKIKNSLAKQLSSGSYSRSLSYFTQQDLLTLQENFKGYSTLFRDHLKQLTLFLSQKVEECVSDSTRYNQHNLDIIKVKQKLFSYCITTIIYRLSSFVYTSHLLTVCQLVHSIINQAEVQAISLINIKFLPCMLEFLLPVDFKNNQILPNVRHSTNPNTLNQLADYYYIWYDKTKLASLSTKVYQYSYSLIQQLKKPNKLSYQNELHQFSEKNSTMKINNDVKRTFTIDQNQDTQNYIVNLLKQVEFCVSSQRKQRIAYENVLDQLTITEKYTQSQRLSSFSESLLKSANQSRGSISRQKNSKRLQGPPHKKFAAFESSISQIQSNHAKGLQGTGSRHSFQPNIYFTRQSPKSSTFQNGLRKSYVEQSFKQVKQTQIQIVAAKNSLNKTPISSPYQSLSFNSSHFSQKQNNLNILHKPKDSPQIQLQQQSGDFVHFENDSLAKTEKKYSEHSIVKPLEQQINFSDTLQIQKSTSQSIIQYGIDKNAKLPPTMKKPKFAFKIADTNDSSLILKNLESSVKQFKKSEPVQTQNVTPKKNEIQKLTYMNNSPKILLFQDKNKAAVKKKMQQSKNYQSPIKSSEKQYVSPIKAAYKDQISRNSPFINKNLNESSNKSSIINQMSAAPYVDSERNSSNLSKVPSNFGSLFKRNKQKQQKASSIYSSRSLRKIRSVQRQVEMPDLKKMRELQNQLGKLKNETENMNKILTEKQKQKRQLQKLKKNLKEQDPYFLKRQNQIMKKILKNRKNNAQTLQSHGSAKLLSQQLKTSSIRNTNMNLKDYNPQILKLRLQNIKAYQKQTKKNIVANRCFLIKNDFIQVGYSFKNKILTLYFTLKHHCDSLDINLNQNSIIYSQPIQRQFDRVVIGRQIKFKTEVKGTKQELKFTPSQLQVKLSYEQKLSKKTQSYNEQLPLTPYNLATPQTQTQFQHLSRHKDSITHYITPLYHSCEDLLRKGSKYLYHLFPHGDFDDNTNTCKIYFQWKGRGEQIRLKVKQRMFRLQGVGHPLQTGRQLIQSIINMLVAHN